MNRHDVARRSGGAPSGSDLRLPAAVPAPELSRDLRWAIEDREAVVSAMPPGQRMGEAEAERRREGFFRIALREPTPELRRQARAASLAFLAAMAPAPSKIMGLWIAQFVGGVRNPPSEETFRNWGAAAVTMMRDLPAACWTEETLRSAWADERCRFLPGVGDLDAVLRPIADRLIARQRWLEAMAVPPTTAAPDPDEERIARDRRDPAVKARVREALGKLTGKMGSWRGARQPNVKEHVSAAVTQFFRDEATPRAPRETKPVSSENLRQIYAASLQRAERDGDTKTAAIAKARLAMLPPEPEAA